MPKGIRSDAYLFLLAIVGHSWFHRTDGRVALTSASAIARQMEVNVNRMLDALVKESFVLVEPGVVVIPKFDKWQVTAAELADLSAERAAAGAKGGRVSADLRKQKQEANTVAIAQANASTVGEDFASKQTKQIQAEKNRTEKTRQTEASSNEDARLRLKVLQGQVRDLWKDHCGWTAWPKDRRFDAITIGEWLKIKPYPVEFWQWVMPQVPGDTKAFVRLTTPADEGKRIGWLEEKFIGWRDARDLKRRTDEDDVPSIGELIQRGAA